MTTPNLQSAYFTAVKEASECREDLMKCNDRITKAIKYAETQFRGDAGDKSWVFLIELLKGD